MTLSSATVPVPLSLPQEPARRRGASWAIVTAAVLLLAVVLAGVMAAGIAGLRWFMVESPSMGRAAPVGTLVVTAPVRLDELHVGDVITFRPPSGPSRVFTHRVDELRQDGVRTRGDLNGAEDPDLLAQTDLVGRAVLLLPGAGWLLRAAPVLVVGICAVWLLARAVRRPSLRSLARMLGVSLLVSGTAVWLRPFTGVQVIATSSSGGRSFADVVSTGLLPIGVSVQDGSPIRLLSGQTGRLSLPVEDAGRFLLRSTLDLDPLQWAVLALVCLSPVIFVLVFGVPADEPAP